MGLERWQRESLLDDNICFASLAVPCQPANLTVHVDCGTNKANFTWPETTGAGFYTVEVTGAGNQMETCSSNDTSCSVKLHCGQQYVANLVASTKNCNSTIPAEIHFDSGET